MKTFFLIYFFFIHIFPGEVERLLKEYRQNQELVRKIGSHYYQIIYPVQLRHHEKMGISTREVGGAKVRNRLRKRNSNIDTVCFIFILIPTTCLGRVQIGYLCYIRKKENSIFNFRFFSSSDLI